MEHLQNPPAETFDEVGTWDEHHKMCPQLLSGKAPAEDHCETPTMWGSGEEYFPGIDFLMQILLFVMISTPYLAGIRAQYLSELALEPGR